MRTLVFKACTVLVFDRPYLETRFEDGSCVPAAPNFDPKSIAMAHELGYAGDTWAMSRDHEILHTWVAEKMGDDYSPTLWGVAHKQYAPHDVWWVEEARVLALQAYLHTGLDHVSLEPLWSLVEDRSVLVAEARALLRSALENERNLLVSTPFVMAPGRAVHLAIWWSEDDAPLPCRAAVLLVPQSGGRIRLRDQEGDEVWDVVDYSPAAKQGDRSWHMPDRCSTVWPTLDEQITEATT